MYSVGRLIQQLNNYDKELTLEALLEKKEISVIALPQDIHNLFQTWKKNPSHFWKACGAQLGTLWDSEKSIESVATEAYLAVRRLRVRRLWDTILWRFYANFFYSLALLLGNGQVNMSDGLYQRLLKVLQSEKITDEIAVIEGNLRSWTAAGSRYHKICLRLDKGALFLLPQVPDNV
ncbi:hypothetical protein B0J14DRAFT_620004 [Halenospora varia]|nr:hypothetical protein B0J14DRAFT_620004 [Halenospora varia]